MILSKEEHANAVLFENVGLGAYQSHQLNRNILSK
jgi:hypothetical protein